MEFIFHLIMAFIKKVASIPIARQVNQEKSRDVRMLTAEKSFKQNTFPFDNEKVVYDTLVCPNANLCRSNL